MHLTKQVIAKARYEGDAEKKTWHILWDDEIPRFGVRLFPSGRKIFVLRYYNASGQRHLFKVGEVGVLSLEEARQRARKLLVTVTDGGDPYAEKRRPGETVADLCKVYLERHAEGRKKTWKEDQQRINDYILPAWRNRRADSIGRADAARLHQDIHDLQNKTAAEVEARKKRIDELKKRLDENPDDDDANNQLAEEKEKKARPSGGVYPANRTLALVSKMWNLAATWGVVPDGYPNPARGIEHFRETKRDRWVTAAELPALATAIDAEESVYVRAALWLYLFTGMRRNELLTAKWENFDKDRCELRLPDTKAGRAFVVPLSGPAMAILDALPRQDKNPYIFPSLQSPRENEEPKHLVNISKKWIAIRNAAGVGDVHLHDLRRTVGSWLAMDGASLLVIGKTLNQTSPATTQVYARLSEDPVRGALERLGEKIVNVVKAAPAAPVLDIEESRQRRRRQK